MDITTGALFAFLGVIFVDLVLSGDNAVIIGTVASSLPQQQRNKAILIGMGLAVILRIILSLFAVYLLAIPGLQFFGGLLLFWVAWGMWKDLRDDGELNDSTETKLPKSFSAALVSITLADLSMSIDNVLAVAGTAKDHWEALVFGLILSIVLMAFAAKLVADLIDKYTWIAWVGLVMIVGVGAKMIYHGAPQLASFF